MGRYIAGGRRSIPASTSSCGSSPPQLWGAAGASSTGLIGGAQAFLPSRSSGRCDTTPRARSSPRESAPPLAFTVAVSRYADRGGWHSDAVLAELRRISPNRKSGLSWPCPAK